MERRDLMKLLGASLGGVSLVSCVKEPALGPSLGVEGTPPPVPSGFQFYPLQDSHGVVDGGVTLDHFRLDLSVADQSGSYFGGVDADGKEGIWWLSADYTTSPPRSLGSTKIVHVGDVLPGDPGGRPVVGVHNYDSNRSGDLAVILSFTDDSAAAGGPKVTKEVWLRWWGGAWSRLLYAGLATADGQVLTGVFGDIDVHTNADILVTGWFQPRSDVAALQAQDPNYPDGTAPQQGLFSLQGGNVATLSLELSDDRLQATDGGVAALGLLDMHDDGRFTLQAFPSRIRTADGPGMTDVPADVRVEASGPYLVAGRVGRGARGAAPLTAPVGGTRNPLFTVMGGPSGNAWFGPRTGPGGATAYLLQETDTQTALYYNGGRLLGVGDVLPASCAAACPIGATVPDGTNQDRIRAINPPVFGAEGEVYAVVETVISGSVLCATDGQRIWRFQVQLTGDPRVPVSLVLGHLTESVDSSGRLYVVAVFDDASASILVGIPY